VVRGEMPLAPRARWFSPKCVEAQQLTGHLGVKHGFGAGRESGTKSRQTLNTRYDLKITGGQGRLVRRWGISLIVERERARITS